MSPYTFAMRKTSPVIPGRTAMRRRLHQSGASMTEFVVVAPVLMLLGLGTLQAGLVQHARTTLNYATFEAARTGAVHHALPAPMRRELGIRLAPLQGGDGSMGMAAAAIARSSAEIMSPVDEAGQLVPPTRLKVLSPSADAFAAWGRPSLEYADKIAIPNSHLRRQPDTVASGEAGLSLRDANVLTIEVTHAFEMKVPLIGAAVRELLIRHDPGNLAYYRSNRLPLKSVATVRMQSEAWNDALMEARNDPPGSTVPESDIPEVDEPVTELPGAEPSDEEPTLHDPTEENGTESSTDGEDDVCGEEGLPLNLPLSTSAYESGSCGIADTGYDSPTDIDLPGDSESHPVC